MKNKIDKHQLYAKMKGFEFNNVDFSYERDKVLVGANLFINKGDFVVIEGRSGVGKSTLMKLMLGVYELDGGSISIKTENENVALDNSTRPLFAYVPQGNMLFSGTIKENVTFIKKDATDDEIERALDLSLSNEFVRTLPSGLNTVVGEHGVGLSEGQIQRIAIARAVLCDCPVILLDEATSALDEETERKVLDNLKSLREITLIIVSHKKAPAHICNRKIKIKNGKIIED